MIITYQGVQSFKVQFGDTTLSFDPVSKDSKHKASNFGADIALISINHPDMNGSHGATRGEKQAFVIDGPGEYEVGGVFVKCLTSVSKYDGVERINTIYFVNLEGMNLCFLGALGNPALSPETKGAIENIDILFTPISGEGVLSPSEAYKLVVSLEPSIIIPMNYPSTGSGQVVALKLFLKEGGGESTKPVDKLTIKKKDLDGKESEIIVLDYA